MSGRRGVCTRDAAGRWPAVRGGGGGWGGEGGGGRRGRPVSDTRRRCPASDPRQLGERRGLAPLTSGKVVTCTKSSTGEGGGGSGGRGRGGGGGRRGSRREDGGSEDRIYRGTGGSKQARAPVAGTHDRGRGGGGGGPRRSPRPQLNDRDRVRRPVDRRNEVIVDPTISDTVLDRLGHTANRLTLDGETLRKPSGGGGRSRGGKLRQRGECERGRRVSLKLSWEAAWGVGMVFPRSLDAVRDGSAITVRNQSESLAANAGREGESCMSTDRSRFYWSSRATVG